ncbi:MAG TPA: biopolymer transporter ExbD [Planctomycetota bacterium]|nr:biopolymer transporter ExbD [Planctomycetota bacterium]
MSVRRRKRMRAIVPTASFADIAFLLNIFFMVTSNFIKEGHIELTQPRSPEIEPMKEGQVSVALDKNGDLWLQGKPCPVEVLEEGVKALIAELGEKTVMLKIDKDIRQEKFGPVFLALSRAGAELALIGQKAKE